MIELVTNVSAADPVLFMVLVWIGRRTIARIDALEKHSDKHNVRLTVLENVTGTAK